MMHTTKPNPKPDHWLAHVDFKIGNKEYPHRQGEGMAIYYLQEIDAENPNLLNNFYGFTNNFRGFGVFINTAMSYPDRKSKKKVVQIFGFTNDGKNMKPQSRSDKQCYREVFGDHLHFSKIAIEYEKPLIRVSTYDHDSREFVHCFSYDIESLAYPGYFAVSASSGTQDTKHPMYNQINSFKVYDPKVVSMDHHFEDSHLIKAQHEMYADAIADRTDDLIHSGAIDLDENGEEIVPEDLPVAIATQMYYL